MNYPDNKKRYVSITRRLPFNVRQQKTVVRSGLSQLLRSLHLDSLRAPLARLGVIRMSQLGKLSIKDVPVALQMKLAKLLLFVQGPWLELYQASSDRAGVIQSFNDHAVAQFQGIWASTNHGQCSSQQMSQAIITSPVLVGVGRGIMASTTLPVRTFQVGYRRKWVLTFGVDQYSHWQPLRNACSDARELSDYFVDRLGFQSLGVVLDGNVTKDAMAMHFQKIAPRQLDHDDLFVVSFHGHGHTRNFHGRDHGFLVPSDAPKNPTPYDLISMAHLTDWLQYVPCRHVLLLLDACFSGLTAMRGAMPKAKTDPMTAHQARQPRHISYHLSKMSRIVINAGHEFQQVSDGGWGQHSIFTGAILTSDVFRNNSTASIYQFFESIRQTVQHADVSEQVPTMGRLRGDTGADIFLGLGAASEP